MPLFYGAIGARAWEIMIVLNGMYLFLVQRSNYMWKMSFRVDCRSALRDHKRFVYHELTTQPFLNISLLYTMTCISSLNSLLASRAN